MEILWRELTHGLPDAAQLLQVLIRLTAASLLGAAVGAQRHHAGKEAGLRTHMLVCLGTAVFVLAGSMIDMTTEGLSRVIQGIVTGIGFLGAGNILKIKAERDIHGLTTAAGVWLTAAIGVAVGTGSLGVAVLGTIFAVLILGLLGRLEQKFERRRTPPPKPPKTD